MIAEGLHLLLNLPDLGWATADAPKQFKTKKSGTVIKEKSTPEPNCEERNNGPLPSVDTALLIEKPILTLYVG